MLQGKWGKVSAHGEKGFVRVTFPDADGVASPLLPVGYQWTGHVQVWNPPPVGLRVYCLLDDNAESGIVAFAAYTTADTPPSDSPDVYSLTFADGAKVEYDQAAHALKADLSAANGSAEVKAPAGVRIAGHVYIDGMLDVSGAVGVGGSLGVDGGGTFGADVTASGTSLKGHTHMTAGGLPPAATSPPL